MAMDVYAPCPCGSGKKLKFCCHNIAEDMDRISRLIENHQSRQAIQQLEALDRKMPDHAWVATTHAVVLLESGEALAARDRLRTFLQAHPEHEFATVIYAAAQFQCDGLESARPAIARAFQKGAKHYPSMVSGIASAMAAVLYSQEKLLAARAHQALALRFAPDAQRQEIFMRLVEFDGDRSILYPLRSAHPLPNIEGDAEVTGEVRKALKYASVGCWDTAAQLLEKISAQLPESAEVCHTIGLCRAWHGDEQAAAKWLHQAGRLYENPSPAVECETLAQILDWSTAPNRNEQMEMVGTTSSVSRILTDFDNHPRLLRSEPPQVSSVEATRVYHVMDMPRDQFPPIDGLTIDNLPKVLGRVYVTDGDAEEKTPGHVILASVESHDFDEAGRIVREAAGDLVQWEPPKPTGESVPREFGAFLAIREYPAKTPLAVRRRIEIERWKKLIEASWKTTPQPALNGLSPIDAGGRPELRVPLLAAVYALDAICLRSRHELETTALLQSLNVEPLPPVALEPDTSLNSLSPLEWLRLPLGDLTDEQLVAVTNRAQLIHHDHFLYETLKIIVQRPECLDQVDDMRIFMTLVDLCRDHQRRDEALQYLSQGRDRILKKDSNFEQQWYWDLQELSLRLEDPDDPELAKLTNKFVQYYTPKLPQMRTYLERVFELSGLPSPWQGALFSPEGSGNTGGLWTPDAGEPAPSGSKLWVPG